MSMMESKSKKMMTPTSITPNAKSFWRSDSKVPVITYKMSYPTANGLNYSSNGNNKIQIQIPMDCEFIQPSDSYLKFKFDYTFNINHASSDPNPLGNCNQRLQLIPELGANAIIKNLIIRDGRGTTLESVTNANALSSIKLMYDDQPQRRNKRCSTEGCVEYDPRNRMGGSGHFTQKLRSYNISTNPYFDDTTAFLKKSVSVCIPFHCSGLLGEINKRLLPVSLLGGLEIFIELEEPRYVMRGIRTAISTQIEGDKHYLPKLKDPFADDGTEYTTLKLQNYFPYTDLNSLPFCVGEMIGVTDVADLTGLPELIGKITAIAMNGADIEITYVGVNANSKFLPSQAYAAGSLISSCAIYNEDTTLSLNYTISNVEMIVQKCEVDPRFSNAMIAALKEGGNIEYPFLSYQNYQRTVNNNELLPTIDLPLQNSMAKSILYQPTIDVSSLATCLQNFRNHTTSYFKLCGNTLDASKYGVFIGGRQNPDRDVDLSRTSGDGSKGYSQRALDQLTHALTQADITPTNFLTVKNNFVIGKPLSLGNGSADIRQQDLQLQITYDTISTSNKNFNNFVAHTRRLVFMDGSAKVVL